VTVPRIEAAAPAAVLGVRPEHVSVGAEGGGMPAEVRHVEYFGSHWVADLATAAGVLKAVIDKAHRPVPGDRVAIGFHTDRLVLFDTASEQLLPSATTRLHLEAKRHGQH
jgi:multiple sugar transport system ATP-binding protein